MDALCGWKMAQPQPDGDYRAFVRGGKRSGTPEHPPGQRSRAFFRKERPAESKHITDEAYTAENEKGDKQVT